MQKNHFLVTHLLQVMESFGSLTRSTTYLVQSPTQLLSFFILLRSLKAFKTSMTVTAQNLRYRFREPVTICCGPVDTYLYVLIVSKGSPGSSCTICEGGICNQPDSVPIFINLPQ